MKIVLYALLFIIIAPLVGGLLSGADRVIGARMQGRVGPPLLQPFYDLAKLFTKRANVVNGIQSFMVVGHLLFIVFSGCIFFAGGDFLLATFAQTLGEIFMCIAASSASSPYSSMGSQRELLQMMCCEPLLLILGIGFYMSTGSFMLKDIVLSDTPAIVKLPGIFIAFIIILIIELRMSPFDVSTSHHAHQEMVKGITTDLTGNIFALVELSEWFESAFMFSVVGLFFITSNPISILWAILAAAVVFFIETLIDNIFPRVKWEKMFQVAWISTFVLGGVNILILSVIH